MKPRKRIAAIGVAALSLLVLGVAGSAQKHFMLSSAAHPEVKMRLSSSVQHDSALVPLDKVLSGEAAPLLKCNLTISELQSS